ncbi:MAG: DUF4339 domain-containing protein [Bacteriovorax sp.]
MHTNILLWFAPNGMSVYHYFIEMNKDWFIFKGTHHLGPFSVEEMVAFYQNKEITDQTLVWKEGVEKWEKFSKSE